MSTTNGIGNLQALSNPVAPASAAAATGKDQPVKTVAAAQVVAKVSPPVDDAVISSTSGLLAQALSGSDVRLEKVLPLQAAISAGTYNVSASAVADKLIANLLQ